ncbi:MAG: hypothetical protein E7523_12160 [Ruminococcaceae bacterium]|nr:hypothetical protein [Oscillospiraceae bacterium]
MKKYLAVFLAALMMLSVCFIPVSAEETEESAVNLVGAENFNDLVELGMEETQYPTIMLPGINHSVYYVDNDENGIADVDSAGATLESGLLLMNTADLVGTILKDLVGPLLGTLMFQRDMGLTDAIYDLVGEVFSYMAMDADGTPKNNIGVYDYQTPVSLWTQDQKDWFYSMMPMQPYTSIAYESDVEGGNNTLEDMTYLCTFPLLGNPMESAYKLKDMVDRLAARYGKVNLCAVSLGGTLLTAYLDIIEEEDLAKINHVIGFVAVLDGTSIIADFYAREWSLAEEKVYHSFFPYLMEQLGEDAMIGYLVNILIRLFPQKVLENIISAAFEGILDTLLVNDPQFWATVPKDRYEALADRYLDEGSVLREKTDRFQEARMNLEDTLTLANEEYGVKVSTVSGYNMRFDEGEYAFFGLVKSVDYVNSDAIIDIKSTSLGATAGAPHQTVEAAGLLRENSVLTPDGLLDISTCLFPDSAFFFKGQHHEIGTNDNAVKLAALLMTGVIDDVNDTELYPQVNGNRNARRIVRPDGGYLVRAEEILADEEGKYTDEQKAVVKEAYDFTLDVIDDTICDAELTKEAEQALFDSFVVCGLEKADKGPDFFTNLLTKIFKRMSDGLWARRGASGFFELPDIAEDVVDDIAGSIGC